MRIAYVCVDPGIPVFGTKGACVHIQEVVRELLALGHQVRVYAARRGDEVPADLAGLHVVEVPVSETDPALRERDQRRVSEEIANRILADGADLIYERYSLFSTTLARVAAQVATPGILEVNAPLIDEQRQHRVLIDETSARAALITQVHIAAATVCVSEPVTEWVRQHTGSATVYTVANGVSTSRIVPQPEEEGPPVVTFVGTLKPWHGVSDLLQAADRADVAWRLRIIGDGPERDRLERQASALGLDIDFRGAVVPERVPEHLAGSAIGVAPYPQGQDQYFSPLKVYEYLAAGLPVVASSVGQLPDILGETGVLVPPSHPTALAAAIDELAADAERRDALGRKGRAQAELRHGWDTVVERILTLAGVTYG